MNTSAYNLVALHITKTVSCTLSIIGATFIIQHVLRSKKRRQRVLTRLILVMSIMDLIFALTLALGSIVIPKNAKLPFPTKAKGNWATCAASGFLGTGSAHSSILYNGSLSLFYLLTIRYGWSEWKLQHHYHSLVEPCLHAIPMIIGWGIAIPALPLDLYNPFPSGCAIIAYPFQCEQGNPQPCQRGKHLGRANFPDIYRFATVFLIRCIVYVFLVVCMTLIYMKLVHLDSRSSTLRRTMEQSSQSLNNNNASSPRPVPCATMTVASSLTTASTRAARSTLNRLTRQFATQAMLYCCAFFITWLFPTIGLVIGLVNGGPIPYPILLLSDLFTPLQGFWNAFIYLRPRYLRYRRQQQQEEERQRQAQEQAEARRMARVAHLLAQQGLAFVQALSAQNENDDDGEEDYDKEDEDYLIMLSNAEERRIISHHPEESNNDNDFPCSTTTPSFNETSIPLPTAASRRSLIETTTYTPHKEDEKEPEPTDLRQQQQ